MITPWIARLSPLRNPNRSNQFLSLPDTVARALYAAHSKWLESHDTKPMLSTLGPAVPRSRHILLPAAPVSHTPRSVARNHDHFGGRSPVHRVCPHTMVVPDILLHRKRYPDTAPVQHSAGSDVYSLVEEGHSCSVVEADHTRHRRDLDVKMSLG